MKQRELKFRAWVANEMFYKNNKTIFSHSNVPTISIMQYTGLKDKNGKEIYEGDIYIATRTSCNPPHKYIPQVVEWNQKFCSFSMVESGATKEIDGHEYEYEVIGNIYENAGLLAVTPNNTNTNSH